MPILCEVCDKFFSSVSNLNKHRKNIHRLDSLNNLAYDRNVWSHTCLEENCSVSFRRNGQLIHHLRNVHNFSIRTEEMEFPDMSTFESWKEEMEIIENCSYILARGKRVNKKGDEITTFVCNRSGKERSRETCLKPQGSCKKGISCISELRITTKGNRIFVTRVVSHYGHDIESTYLCASSVDTNNKALRLEDTNKFRKLDDVKKKKRRNCPFYHNEFLTHDKIVKDNDSGQVDTESSICSDSDNVDIRYLSDLSYEGEMVENIEDSMQDEDSSLDEDSTIDEDSIIDENSSFEDVVVLAPIKINGENDIQDKDKLKEKIQSQITAIQARILITDFNNVDNTILRQILFQLTNIECLLKLTSTQISPPEISMNINSYKVEKDKAVFTTKTNHPINNKFLEVGLPSSAKCKKIKTLLGNSNFDNLLIDHDYV